MFWWALLLLEVLVLSSPVIWSRKIFDWSTSFSLFETHSSGHFALQSLSEFRLSFSREQITKYSVASVNSRYIADSCSQSPLCMFLPFLDWDGACLQHLWAAKKLLLSVLLVMAVSQSQLELQDIPQNVIPCRENWYLRLILWKIAIRNLGPWFLL